MKQSSDCSNGEPKKKPRQCQQFLDKYTLNFPGIKRSTIGPTFAHCTFCNDDFSIHHGGADDIKRHFASQKHKSRKQMKKSAATMQDIKTFMPRSSEELTSLDKLVIAAETKMTELIVKLNLPLSPADTITKAVKSMFPDSRTFSKIFSCTLLVSS